MNYKTIIAVLFFTFTVSAKADPIYDKIIKFNPKIDKNIAKNVSLALKNKAKDYNIDPNIALAILLQESGLRFTTTFKTETITKEYCDEENCYKINNQIQKGFDFSFAQINISTIKNYKMNIQKLYSNDIDYVVECFMFILKDKIQMCAHLENSWSCYHSINSPHRELYIELVKRYI